jgi:Tol biopolymer transport system component
MNATFLRSIRLFTLLLLAAGFALGGCGGEDDSGAKNDDAATDEGTSAAESPAVAREALDGEKHLENIRQLTFGGENAEAYWSFDDKRLIFQSTRPPFTADQIFVMADDGSDVRLVSTGKGRTTCSYFLPGDRRIVYASTHLAGDAPPTPPPFDPRLGYVWSIWNSYEIFTADPDGTNLVNISNSPGYDAEATVSPEGGRMVFTSTRDGDLDLYTMDLDGGNVVRVTTAPGYDGGAFFSWDGKKIVWRAPNRDDVDVEETKRLLARQLVRPSKLEIWIMDADGGNKRMVTNNGAANFGPFWHPDGKRIIFSTNVFDPKGRNFDLALVDVETLKVERVTFFERMRPGARRSDDFDGFPMFTSDGKRLVWCSNRFNEKANETNVFVADWVD